MAVGLVATVGTGAGPLSMVVKLITVSAGEGMLSLPGFAALSSASGTPKALATSAQVVKSYLVLST